MNENRGFTAMIPSSQKKPGKFDYTLRLKFFNRELSVIIKLDSNRSKS